MIFKGSFFLFSFFICIVSLVIVWKISDVRRKDYLEYEMLLQSSGDVKKENQDHFFSKHFRKGGVKEIWWGKNQPIYIRVECDNSELIAAPHKEKYEAIEKMHYVRCLYQEKLFYLSPDGGRPHLNEKGNWVIMDGEREQIFEEDQLLPCQEVRCFNADEGVCSYKNLDFIGFDVTMKKYQINDHQCPSFSFPDLMPISTGKSKKLKVGLKEGVNLHLENFQTTFSTKEGI